MIESNISVRLVSLTANPFSFASDKLTAVRSWWWQDWHPPAFSKKIWLVVCNKGKLLFTAFFISSGSLILVLLVTVVNAAATIIIPEITHHFFIIEFFDRKIYLAPAFFNRATVPVFPFFRACERAVDPSFAVTFTSAPLSSNAWMIST